MLPELAETGLGIISSVELPSSVMVCCSGLTKLRLLCFETGLMVLIFTVSVILPSVLGNERFLSPFLTS